MRYLPQTSQEIEQMCRTVGVSDPQDLFRSIPQSFRLQSLLDLPGPLSESELLGHLKNLSQKNQTVESQLFFLGAGAYHHYIPTAVSALASRGEFATSYTPYQPELSQGTLQAIFEFQTMVASLLGFEVANASNYDGSTALAEAVMMAMRITKKNEVILARSIHPEYRQVVRTTLQNLGAIIHEVGFGPDGKIATAELQSLFSQETAVVCLQSPNFFGVVEEIETISQLAHAQNSLLVTSVTDPISLGLLASPGSQGADIAVGEGQSFGIPLSVGGPYLGLFATKKEYVRQLPGRLVGETVDSHGNRGFALTLNTREQHIRREKATSNICTNQSLCALSASIYLSLIGPQGLKQLALDNFSKAQFAKKTLLKVKGVQEVFSGATFHEFAVRFSKPVEGVLERLLEKNIVGGLALNRFYPELENTLLVCVTEMISRKQIEAFAQELGQAIA